MPKLLLISDCGVPTGYGRIADSIATRLHKRGWTIHATSFAYDGLMPAVYEGAVLPYHVAPLQGRNGWPGDVANIAGAYQPDIVMVMQDAPYGEAVYNSGIDWSRYGFVMLTPVDGAPIYPNWVNLMKQADGALTISQFGVNAYREAGVQAVLCRPGVEANSFYELAVPQKQALRQQLGVPQDAFIVGTMCQNQGRKDVPDMLRAFFEFAKDKPNALYLLDMDKLSPVGFDIEALCKQHNWERNRLIFREDCIRKGILHLRERYNLLDVHMVLAHREGYGLPLAEAMACGVVSMALDYTSGTEICGEGQGLLVKPIEYTAVSTWGGALDYFPDIEHMVSQLNLVYNDPNQRAVIAKKGMEWARQQTWDKATDAVHGVLNTVLERKTSIIAMPAPTTPAPTGQSLLHGPAPITPTQPQADGMQTTQHDTVKLKTITQEMITLND